MPRGYRLIVLAAVGWLIVAASPEGQGASREGAHTQREIADALKGIDASLKEANKPSQLDRECDPKQPKRDSDLCAQWQAADAAVESALWTERGVWLGVGGLLVGLLTLVAAWSAARWAKAAAVETRNSVLIANKSLDIARNLEDGFIYFSVSNSRYAPRNSDAVWFDYSITNIGRSPVLISHISWGTVNITQVYSNELIRSGDTFKSRNATEMMFSGNTTRIDGEIVYNTAVRRNSKVPLYLVIFAHNGGPHVQVSTGEPIHSNED